MNKIFKVVWSKSKECYVGVSEFAKNNSGKKKIVVAGIFAALAMTNANVALAVNDVPTGASATAVAFGTGASVTGANAVGLGKNVKATLSDAVVIGTDAKAETAGKSAAGRVASLKRGGFHRTGAAPAYHRDCADEGKPRGFGAGHHPPKAQPGVLLGAAGGNTKPSAIAQRPLQ